MSDLNALPRGYLQTLSAIRLRYDQLSPQQLLAAADKYHARYILASHPISQLHLVDASGRYMLYDLSR